MLIKTKLILYAVTISLSTATSWYVRGVFADRDMKAYVLEETSAREKALIKKVEELIVLSKKDGQTFLQRDRAISASTEASRQITKIITLLETSNEGYKTCADVLLPAQLTDGLRVVLEPVQRNAQRTTP